MGFVENLSDGEKINLALSLVTHKASKEYSEYMTLGESERLKTCEVLFEDVVKRLIKLRAVEVGVDKIMKGVEP